MTFNGKNKTMNTHIDKTQENKSQLTINTVSQKESSNGSAFQLVDNRQEAVAQRKLQEMMNNRPALIQLKKLQSKKLNVVGENHKESNERREQEKSLAKQEVGGEYWIENEFRIRKRKLLEMYAKGSESDPRAFGDPIYLRIAESLMYVEAAKGAFIENWKNWIKEDQEEGELAQFKFELQKILVDCKTHLNEAFRLGTQALNNEESKEHDVAQGFYMEQIRKTIEETRTYFLKMAEIWKAENLSKLIEIGFPDQFKEFSNQIDILCISAKQLGGGNFDVVRQRRSDAMDKGAEKGKSQVGVWKIGYEHVQDIKEKMEEDEAKDYELIDRKEFNEEYKQLPILVDGEMVPQVGASGNEVFNSITEDML